jgi:hypothetical protein
MTSRTTILTGAALAAAVTLAGCSSGSAPKASGSAAAATPSTTASAAISGTQLTGTQLTAALLTVADLPVTGFSPPAGNGVTSGGSLTTAKAKYALSTLSCADQQNDLGDPGFGETAMSTNNMSDETSKETIIQTVYQFADAATAQTFFTTLKTRWDACGTFTIDSQGIDATLTVKVTPAKSGVGQQDFANTMTGKENGTPTVLASTVALDGSDVLMIGSSKIGSTTVPTDIDCGSLLTTFIGKVAAAG